MSNSSVAAGLEAVTASKWRVKVMFWLDASLLVSVCALQTVPSTGLVLHEWLGLALIAMVLAHLLLSWTWIASISRRLFTPQSIRTRINHALNVIFFGCVTAAIFSGVVISQKAVPTLTGAAAAPDLDWRWDYLHILSAQIVLLLSGLHVAINWEWVVATSRKILQRALGGEAVR